MWPTPPSACCLCARPPARARPRLADPVSLSLSLPPSLLPALLSPSLPYLHLARHTPPRTQPPSSIVPATQLPVTDARPTDRRCSIRSLLQVWMKPTCFKTRLHDKCWR